LFITQIYCFKIKPTLHCWKSQKVILTPHTTSIQNIDDSQNQVVIWPRSSCSIHPSYFSSILWLVGQVCNSLDFQNYFALNCSKWKCVIMLLKKYDVFSSKAASQNWFISLRNIKILKYHNIKSVTFQTCSNKNYSRINYTLMAIQFKRNF
jgi:hypothetical protein